MLSYGNRQFTEERTYLKKGHMYLTSYSAIFVRWPMANGRWPENSPKQVSVFLIWKAFRQQLSVIGHPFFQS
jgi:hypothetical protein